ncbi:hypothetical protein BOTBODRAFT_110252 [Botryobasidium botryosum FD-172 SS1]|uniref:FMN hydroxy acid dehydrogenase domain-containing protein n=1 Tax=Botryobasidium botryosum (strain FD-172 SS1) TaxID=930990 RepID=A0A067MI55_BOTB1|nr:hypothetical protein BOTBODRAFT_110252 [Botryobasidium botryosum FD-172 SS1]
MSTHRRHPDPQPAHLQGSVYEAGLRGEKPSIPYSYEAWEELAHEKLPKTSWGYIHGSAGAGTTDQANKDAFKRWGIIPSRLIPTVRPDLTTAVLGRQLAYPIALAPVGVHSIFHPDKEFAVAKAAEEVGVPYTMSTASSTSIEDAAAANSNGERWYQLYWPQKEHDSITKSILKRARASGFTALVVTLDTYILGWRPCDLDTGYNPFLIADTTGVAIGMSDPVFREQWAADHGGKYPDDESQLKESAPYWDRVVFPGVSHSWEDLKFLKENWDGPIVLKGIQTVRDAKKAVEAGMDGIIISNHGGRQVDGCVPSLDCLAPIVDAVGDKLDVMYDSGVRTGSDVIKALALGAKLVFIGRPYIYGLAIGGQEGVKHVLGAILADLDLTLQLSGISSVKSQDLNRDCIQRIPTA